MFGSQAFVSSISGLGSADLGPVEMVWKITEPYEIKKKWYGQQIKNNLSPVV